MADTMMDIKEHGICVDEKRGRVECNYCGKEIYSFNRLRYHLGGIRGNVTPCEKVTDAVRDSFQKILTKKRSPYNRVAEVEMSNVCHNKRRRSENKDDSLSNKIIGRFFYENYIDFSAMESLSFREMMTCQNQIKFPDSKDLSGWMLQEELKEVQAHVKKVKDSWDVTGCSILLDTWIDKNGRDLVTFIADSPAGPICLKSFDVSDIKTNAYPLISLVDELIDEVGIGNVVQIVSCSTSGWVGELGESFAKKGVFWSVSVSHCFELMLMKIEKIASFRDIRDKVNKIMKFINNNPSHGIDITVSSEFDFLIPYLTLESIFKAKNDLVASSHWDKKISKLVNDSSFWVNVERFVKSTSSLIHGLLLFSTSENRQVGYIYETVDFIKESIASEFNHEEEYYCELWDVIDEVWNKYLHSPLHAAGYFLNPNAFYSNDFLLDVEVATGLATSLVSLVRECDVQVKVATQLDLYRLGKDCFEEASQAEMISRISPADWWAEKGSKYPELQSFAVKILSQTCEGAVRYKLKRDLAEKMLSSEGMSCAERKHLENLEFVHYNLYLKSCKDKLSGDL